MEYCQVEHTAQNVVLLQLGEKFEEFAGAPRLPHVGEEIIEVGEHAFSHVVITAGDGVQGQPGGVVERQAVDGMDDRILPAFGESGVLEVLQYRVLHGHSGTRKSKWCMRRTRNLVEGKRGFGGYDGDRINGAGVLPGVLKPERESNKAVSISYMVTHLTI